MQQTVTPFLLSSLPPLPELEGRVPITGAEFLRLVADSSAEPLVETVLLAGDLLVRQTVVSGGAADEPPLAVLDREQAAGEAPLPEALREEGEDEATEAAEDALWERFFRHGLAVAETNGSGFLAAWCRFEMGLRNGCNRLRAEDLDRDVQDVLFPDELVDLAEDDRALVDDAVVACREAPDPLEAQRAVDEGRRLWLERHAAAFSFRDEELAAYAAGLLLVERWQRIAEADAG